MTSAGTTPPKTSGAQFAPTRWTMVLSAGDPTSPRAASALNALCRAYWYPLYAFIRRQGYAPADAQDLTQEFFARLLAQNWVARADRRKGRFRSFLLMAMKRFLAKEYDRSHTVKRGGRIRLVRLPVETAETSYSREPVDGATPEQVFERQWALAILKSVLNRLRQAYAQEQKSDWFETLEPCLVGSRESQPYADLAAKLRTTEGAVKVAVFRLRKRYRECLKEEIAQTVASAAEVDAELRHLFRVLARR